MKVLVACEESQAVCIAFRELGHEAYSCDIQPCSGAHPEWHLQVDALEMLKLKWDLIIAHPPCTYLTNAGARWLYAGHKLDADRYKKGLEGKAFFMALYNEVKLFPVSPKRWLNSGEAKHDQRIWRRT